MLSNDRPSRSSQRQHFLIVFVPKAKHLVSAEFCFITEQMVPHPMKAKVADWCYPLCVFY